MKVFKKSVSSHSTGLVSQARNALASLLWNSVEKSPRRGRLLLEQLESRQVMAGDMDLLFTDGVPMTTATTSSMVFENTTTPEGETVPDLVGFARALDDAGVQYYGAAWCPFCTEQKQLFRDGGRFLPFIEVTNADRTTNAVGIANNITTFPTWVFPDGTRATGVQTLATLSQRSGVAIPTTDRASFAAVGNQTVAIGSPQYVPIDVYAPEGGPVTVSVSVADPTLIEVSVLTGNRSVRINLAGYDDMVFEIFEGEAPRPAGRFLSLAQSNFYDGIIFHRVIDNFVIQGGDPLGTGTGGSTLGNFDDQFHPDLQHNRSGILSYAKSSDDTNDSQFFITAGPTRTLDFNHSIFGILVEGDDVRDAINDLGNLADKGTNANDKPLIDVRMTSVDVFTDDENSVVKLKAIGNRTGTTSVTITSTDRNGLTFSEVITVNVVADSGTGSNSQPFLNDIVVPATSPNNVPATLQLTHVDVEGDPVTYSANSATTGVTATINSAGLLTVTPSAGFTGNAIVNVSVAPAPGVVGVLSGQNDNQRLTFNFTASSTLTAPTNVDLATSSDTGSSNTDNITNAGSLTFTVAGVQAGNEVRLFSGTTEVGRGTATGTTINITTNNIAALGDGTYTITARQFSGTNSSSASPGLSIVYDATQPVRVPGFPTAANVGTALNVNLSHPEEGSGLRYSFTTAPAGATIDASTGAIAWTPTLAQVGSQSFGLALTDTAGNVRTETFNVAVAGTAIGGIRLEVTNLAGTVVNSVATGDEFLLRMFAQDLRPALLRDGVFAAFADITFDSTRIAPVTTTPIVYGTQFSTTPSGTFAPGLINELGAISSVNAATNLAEVLVATVRMRATSSGTVSFISDPADVVGNEFLLFEVDEEIAPALINYGRVDLNIGGRFTAVNDSFTVAQGSAATSFNVLQNDVFIGGNTGTLTVSSVGLPSNGGTVTIVNNAVRYTPASSFAGTETFTYIATDNTGATQTATATVTVTGTNNPPPTAVADSFTVVEDAAEASFNVRSNDSTSDPGETISVSAVGTPSQGGTARLGTDGATIFYRPAANFFGTETVTYTLLDSRGATATGTVTFTVTPVNDAPPATAITRTVFRSATATQVGSLSDYGTNVDGPNEVLTITLVGTASAGGTFTVSGTNINYVPPSATFTGTDSILYRVTDAGGLAATATLIVTVVDALPTVYTLSLNNAAGISRIGAALTADLSGTTTSGQPVNRSVALGNTSSTIQFADLLPGSYEVSIPAVPFLVGMEQPQRLQFSAVASGGNLTGSVNVGILNPRFISIRDFFNSAPRQAIFAAVAPGRDAVLVVGEQSARANVVAPVVSLNAAASSVTVRGNNATGTATQTVVPAVNDTRVETRGTSGDLRLLKINLRTPDVTFSAPPTSSTTTAEGEGGSQVANISAPNLFASNSANAEGETMRASSLADGVVSADEEALPVDQAFADVADSLSRISATGDAIAEADSSAPSPEAVDQLLADLQ